MRARKAVRPVRGNEHRNLAVALAGTAAVLAGMALVNIAQTKRAEEKRPPLGDFVTVDGVRLHYVERGAGTPVVLIHGNATMVQDWVISGVLDALAQSHRVIAFDRPGFGYSERPRSRIWTPAAQADLLAKAFSALGIEAATVVGHSLGTQVAIALALNHGGAAGQLVLLGGYYYPTVRPDALLAAPAALPLIGDLLRFTVSPLWGAAMVPQANAKLFAPAAIPEIWTDAFPFSLMLRPSQIHAEAADGAMMVPASAELSKRSDELMLPVAILAGAGDRIADPIKQSRRLHETLPHSRFQLVKGAGHMVHHTALMRVVDAIEGDAGARR
ncbi:MAG: alpha/beta hydrolase [Alphaproteobacteria bacterium]|nr:MAG: alpha/beta hydrolase [Alphaproteobacteria bacterium]